MINRWAIKKLCYGGRLQLIKSVLSSIHIYWTSVLVLPKKVIKKIESLMASFLWAGEVKTRCRAEVKWDEVCRPKKEGRLGLVNWELWNKCLITSHVWNIHAKNIVWVKWVGSYGFCWKVAAFGKQKLLALALGYGEKFLNWDAQPLIKVIIGDDCQTLLWRYNLHPSGPLLQSYSLNLVGAFDSSLDAKVEYLLY